MGDTLIPPGGPSDDGIEVVNLKDALEERYLAYALSTIMHRALPDVRDGLKPVHRRLLYAMRLLRLDPESGHKKCARVVGDVIGKYHPHGDQSVYDALVRLAQDFAVRYPLVDGQGNFGNIDGDNAAAMRYTEARLTETARRLLDGIDEDAVDFRETYDGEESEPVVLPGDFPNLLANGSSGIAVGMATSIPPHNAAELCQAALMVIEDSNVSIEKMMTVMPGPDFPTGGIITEPHASMLEAYETGRGGFRVRARWEKEETGRGTYVIVITEIPYQVQKSRLIEKIAELLIAKKLPLLADVRDESAEDLRVVLEPKSRTVDPVILMESLFKVTDLENRVSLNMNVLSRGIVPKVMSLRDVLSEWLDHKKEVLQRRARFRLAKIEHRLEVLGGYLIAYLNLDEVIRIIRYEDEPKKELIATFELTDVQAEAILNMRLRALRKLEELEIKREYDELSDERDDLMGLLDSQGRQWRVIGKQLEQLCAVYGPDTPLGRRRTSFADAPETTEIDLTHAMIEREPITIVLSDKGWIRALKGHFDDIGHVQFKGDDRLKLHFKAETTDKILIVATNGKVFTVTADRLPGGRGFGEPLRLIVDVDAGVDFIAAFVHDPTRKLLMAASNGNGFVVAERDLIANTRKGKQVLNVTMPVEARACVPVRGDRVAVVGENRKLLIFPLSDLPVMGRGRGVRLQKYKDGGLSDVRTFAAADGLTWTDTSGRTRTVEDFAEWEGQRAQAGRLPPRGFPTSNTFGAVKYAADKS